MSYEVWTEEEKAALKFQCPYCHVGRNKWCETWNREMRAKKLHKQRIENAKVNAPTVKTTQCEECKHPKHEGRKCLVQVRSYGFCQCTVNQETGGAGKARVEVAGSTVEAFDVDGNKTFSTKEEVKFECLDHHCVHKWEKDCTEQCRNEVKKVEQKTGSEGFSTSSEWRLEDLHGDTVKKYLLYGETVVARIEYVNPCGLEKLLAAIKILNATERIEQAVKKVSRELET